MTAPRPLAGVSQDPAWPWRCLVPQRPQGHPHLLTPAALDSPSWHVSQAPLAGSGSGPDDTGRENSRFLGRGRRALPFTDCPAVPDGTHGASGRCPCWLGLPRAQALAPQCTAPPIRLTLWPPAGGLWSHPGPSFGACPEGWGATDWLWGHVLRRGPAAALRCPGNLSTALCVCLLARPLVGSRTRGRGPPHRKPRPAPCLLQPETLAPGGELGGAELRAPLGAAGPREGRRQPRPPARHEKAVGFSSE